MTKEEMKELNELIDYHRFALQEARNIYVPYSKEQLKKVLAGFIPEGDPNLVVALPEKSLGRFLGFTFWYKKKEKKE